MTSFENIFNIFMSETKHTSLAKLSEADLVYILEHYLETSALVEFKKCRKDLTKYTKTKFITLINGNIDVEEDINSNTYAVHQTVVGSEEQNTEINDDNFNVECEVTYKIKEMGYFEEELSYEECYILALAMILHQLQSNLNREEYFKRTISDRDFKLAGGEKILASVMELEKTTRKKLKKYKNSYSYNYFQELREI